MKICNTSILLFALLVQLIGTGCNGQANKPTNHKTTASKTPAGKYNEGSDYILFNRVRIMDKTGFENGAEAYSLLLPKSWKQQSNVEWNMPQTPCAGTFRWLKATGPNGSYSFEIYPDIIFSWSSDPQMLQFMQQNPSASPYCATAQPMDAEKYLKTVFIPNELNNASVVKLEQNPLVVQEMQQADAKGRAELMQYGSADVRFYHTAINATMRWSDKTEGIVVLGVTVVENTIPNQYTGTYSKSYTTKVTKRIVYRYPPQEKEQAVNQYSVIMGSLRTNQAWTAAVNKFWKDARQNSHIAHVGKIRMIDEQTRAIGNAAIKKGQDRLNTMDMDIRSWEQKQSAQDRMHTNFVKTIREVENYQDATGKIELSSGYNHAWSRGDGSNFIMSNNPNFNPSSALLDQNWKEMKKVD